MRQFWIIFFLCVFVAGCAAFDRFEACKGDPACVQEMEAVKSKTHVISEGAASSFSIPSIPELIAIVVSNAVSFGFGVLKGGKKKG